MDVFSSFEEDVYAYSYRDVGTRAPLEFCFGEEANLHKCNETDQAVAPDGTPLPFSFGRCCWCGGWNAKGLRRAPFECNPFDQIFKGGIWLTKSCPRVRGPWYSAFRIGKKKYRWSIDVELSWFNASHASENWTAQFAREAEGECLSRADGTDCARLRRQKAGTVSRRFRLDAGVREVHDEEFGIVFNAVFDAAGERRLQPLLSNEVGLQRRVLFVPSFPLDDPVVVATRQSCALLGAGGRNEPQSCTKNALLVPEEAVSFSGLDCNKIGTSLRMWGDPEMFEFCKLEPGDCMGNQLGSYVEWDRLRIQRGLRPEYMIDSKLSEFVQVQELPKIEEATAETLAGAEASVIHALAYEAQERHTTVLTFRMRADDIAWVASQSSDTYEAQLDCDEVSRTSGFYRVPMGRWMLCTVRRWVPVESIRIQLRRLRRAVHSSSDQLQAL
eukprot:Polyplicarium_translucidae@DN3238_c0_g1_i1.p1